MPELEQNNFEDNPAPPPVVQKEELSSSPETPETDDLFDDDEDIEIVEWTNVRPSQTGQKTTNPIRSIVEVMNAAPNSSKSILKLHLGDPTTTGALPTHPNVTKALVDAAQSGNYNGYGPAIGYAEVRRALADHISTSAFVVTADDIVMTSGCSHALQLAIEALGEVGSNMLMPSPGFPLYETFTHALGVEARHYELLPDEGWRVDLKHMESLLDEQTTAIIVNNPSNPTGAVYTKEHLIDILRLAEKYRVPVIADEIYGDMVFGGAEFFPMRTLEPRVPMLTCDGISKRYLIPGWRLGWIVFSGINGILDDVYTVVCQLTRKINGPSSIIQGALPSVLRETPQEFFDHTRRLVEKNTDIVCRELKNVPGLTPIRAYGAIYMMINIDMKRFPQYHDCDVLFMRALIAEESLYCLPGSAFYHPQSIRFVLAQSEEEMFEACHRLRTFCQHHYRAPVQQNQVQQKVRSASESVHVHRVYRQQMSSEIKLDYGNITNAGHDLQATKKKLTRRQSMLNSMKSRPLLVRQPSFC